MAMSRKPVPGCYYINLTGQLIKVRALLYVQGTASRVLFEYLDGNRANVSLEEWDWLDLSCYRERFGTQTREPGELES